MVIPCGSGYDVLLLLLAVDCLVFSPATETRRISCLPCRFDVKQYPLYALGIATLLVGFRPSHFLSVAVGYAYSHGRLDQLLPKPSLETVERWESDDGCLKNFRNRPGWQKAGKETVPSTSGVVIAPGNGSLPNVAPDASTSTRQRPKFPGNGRAIGGGAGDEEQGPSYGTGVIPIVSANKQAREAMAAAAERRNQVSDRDT